MNLIGADYYVSALIDVPTNDVYYDRQWALPVIGAPDAWLTLPSDAPSVTVAVIDSGICADHPDLAGRVVGGWDFVEGDNAPQDALGHGCGVAGIIAADVDNGIGIAGVAPNAQIMPLRVLDASGVGTYSNVAAAIVHAADNGAQIINLSLGGASASTVLENAVNYAVSKGVTVVAAAGNTGGNILYPAAYESVIAVGSVDPDLQRSSFSSYLPSLDLLAPGRDILTTKLDGTYATMSGTSFAAPQVAGVAALEMAQGHTLTLEGGIVSVGGAPVVAEPTETVPLAGSTTPTFTPDASKTDEQVLKEIQASGYADVIITLYDPAAIQAAPPDRLSAVLEAQSSVLAQLSASDFVSTHELQPTYVPVLVGRINANALAVLQAHPLVQFIHSPYAAG